MGVCAAQSVLHTQTMESNCCGPTIAALGCSELAAAMVAGVPCDMPPRHPPSQVVDNLPRYAGYIAFPCLNSIAGQIIYYLNVGVLGARRQAPYRFKKSYGGGFVWRLPIVSTLRTSKPTNFTYIDVLGIFKCF